MLDRDAGGFRIGPADVNVPAARRYLPGTMVLETTLGDADGLGDRARRARASDRGITTTERSHSHRRSPTDHDADHVLLRLIECVQGSAEMKLDCEPAFDYGGLAADWEYTGSGYGEARARSEGMPLELHLVTDLRLGFEGPRARARTTMRAGDKAFVALGWSEHGLPQTYDEAAERLARTRLLLAGVAQARHVPRPPVAHLPAAQRAHAQGPDLRPVRRDGRRNAPRLCPRRRAATATGTTATPGSATPPSCCGRSTRSASTRRPTTSSTSSPTWPRTRRPSSRSCTGSAARSASRSRSSSTSRLRALAAGADRQRRLQPGPARRLGRGARLDLPAHAVARPAARPPVADHQAPGRAGLGALARARPRHLGGARRAQALHLLEADVLGGSSTAARGWLGYAKTSGLPTRWQAGRR